MATQPDFLSLTQLAALVKDGDAIGVGGLHFSRLPIALIQEIIAQKRKNLEYVTWGGGLALELLLAANAVRKMVLKNARIWSM